MYVSVCEEKRLNIWMLFPWGILKTYNENQWLKANDPNHVAKLVTKWLKSNKVDVLKCPSRSPDLSPIENL